MFCKKWPEINFTLNISCFWGSLQKDISDVVSCLLSFDSKNSSASQFRRPLAALLTGPGILIRVLCPPLSQWPSPVTAHSVTQTITERRWNITEILRNNQLQSTVWDYERRKLGDWQRIALNECFSWIDISKFYLIVTLPNIESRDPRCDVCL